MSIDPVRLRIEPAPAIAPVRERTDDHEREPRRRSDPEGEPEREDEPDDGLPHVDVRV